MLNTIIGLAIFGLIIMVALFLGGMLLNILFMGIAFIFAGIAWVFGKLTGRS